MIKRELSNEEIRYALSLEDPNARKSFAQTLIVDYIAVHKHVLVTAHTRFGKGYLLRQLFTRYRKKSNKWINVVVPTNLIRDELEVALQGIPRVRFFLIATYGKGGLSKDQYECGMLVCDEAHHVGNPEARRNSQVLQLTTADIRVLLSATLDRDQKAFFAFHKFTHEFHVPLKTGVRLGIIPAYQNLNIPVQLTDEEKLQYRELDLKILDRLSLFEKVSAEKAAGLAMLCAMPHLESGREAAYKVAKATGIPVNSVVGEAINYRTEVGKRMNLLYEAAAKEKQALQLLADYPVEKTIIFGSRLAVGDRMAKANPLIQVYRGGSTASAKEKARLIKEQFNQGIKPYLFGVKTLNEGLTVNDCARAINLGVTSKELLEVQRTGRLLGLDPTNPNKMAQKINYYADDFWIPGLNPGDKPIKVESQEKKWLINSQRDQLFVYWLTDQSELKEYIDQ